MSKLTDILPNLEKSSHFSSYDLKITIAIGFSVMMIVLFYKVYSFYKKAHTESVQSGEITSEEFIKVSVWPFTIFIIFLIIELTGLYLWFYMPFNL
ncbi:hypothetical protein [Acidithiobacillus concretivorus]|uniref:Uncharacterized protein n=1 Tax=Acidithiobacillus concretivorus TaxID=3063952 RepID=A0ABS5ZSL3_9PROT|nr:hypothetical protein [Acidithiobacillus concretivorus]MBU2739586.1 hypothetical protein [Acidithiobacillus concretivorus]